MLQRTDITQAIGYGPRMRGRAPALRRPHHLRAAVAGCRPDTRPHLTRVQHSDRYLCHVTTPLVATASGFLTFLFTAEMIA